MVRHPSACLRLDVALTIVRVELEWVMAQQGLVKTDLQEDPRLHSGNHRISINIHRKERSGYSGAA